MSKGNDPIDYEPVQQEEPTPFPWIVIIKLAVAVAAMGIALCLLWLLVLICYWFKYGKWPGWHTPWPTG
jgi:hypothetical protein